MQEGDEVNEIGSAAQMADFGEGTPQAMLRARTTA